MKNSTNQESLRLLAAFGNAFNAHDIEGVMACMTEDCVFLTSAGANAEGDRHEGACAVRDAISAIFSSLPDAMWTAKAEHIAGNLAVTEWTFTATNHDGTRITVDGCDLLTLRNGKIASKNAFRKQVK